MDKLSDLNKERQHAARKEKQTRIVADHIQAFRKLLAKQEKQLREAVEKQERQLANDPEILEWIDRIADQCANEVAKSVGKTLHPLVKMTVRPR